MTRGVGPSADLDHLRVEKKIAEIYPIHESEKRKPTLRVRLEGREGEEVMHARAEGKALVLGPAEKRG